PSRCALRTMGFSTKEAIRTNRRDVLPLGLTWLRTIKASPSRLRSLVSAALRPIRNCDISPAVKMNKDVVRASAREETEEFSMQPKIIAALGAIALLALGSAVADARNAGGGFGGGGGHMGGGGGGGHVGGGGGRMGGGHMGGGHMSGGNFRSSPGFSGRNF